ncbi:MAG TPA: exopolysaccharide biosynthesis polyprenyl glycosylphosphotransferase [bacterium]|nr:exopolysaccharide biosynthesis polyprenyl glycosylphosphotransferase [bacterium]
MGHTKLKQFFLLIIDILLLILSLRIALTLRFLDIPSAVVWQNHLKFFIPIFVLWILIFYINSLYDFRKIINQNKLIEQSTKGIAVAFVISIIFFYIFPDANMSPKTILLIFTISFYLLFLIWRLLFLMINKKYLPSINIAIIGYNEIILKIIQTIKKNKQLGYTIKFIQTEKNNVLVDIAEQYDLMIIDDVNQLSRAIKEYKINILILEKDVSEMKELQKTLFNLLPTGISYYNLTKFYEEISGQIPIEILNKGWFLENLNLASKRNFERIKRLYDLVLATLLLLLTLPFWPLIILIIKLGSRGPIIFKQVRVGKNGQHFNFYKFRSMREENNNREITEKHDKRVTPFGQFMRKTRIDELPQLINVLKGDMAFVGPRPERPEIIKELSKNIPFYGIRNLIKPGITGWDQISGEYHSASINDTYKKLQYDLYYLKNRSVYFDLSIILKTIKTALSREGV